MPWTPEENPILQDLKRIALNGRGEHGPHFDRGVLSVIEQIEKTGKYQPDHAALYVVEKAKKKPTLPILFTPAEQIEMERESNARGLTTPESIQFCEGIIYAQLALKDYSAEPGM